MKLRICFLLNQGLTNFFTASLVFFGQTLSAFAIGMMSNRFGRQKTMAAMSIPALAAWILIYFSNGNTVLIFMARFLKGFLIMTSVWQVIDISVGYRKFRITLLWFMKHLLFVILHIDS